MKTQDVNPEKMNDGYGTRRSESALAQLSGTRLAAYLLVALSVLAASCPKVIAQQREYYKSTPNQGKGYWRLSTDYSTQHTTIRFFNPENQVIYQESLPGHFVKLTKRNVELIEQTFERFVKNKLVQAEVTARVLSETDANAAYQVTASSRNKPDETPPSEKPSSSLQVGLYAISNQRAFRLLFRNLPGDKVIIRIKNQAKEDCYSETIRNARVYNRKFNLAPLTDGIYDVEITTGKERWSRQIELSSSPHLPTRVIEDINPLAGNY